MRAPYPARKRPQRIVKTFAGYGEVIRNGKVRKLFLCPELKKGDIVLVKARVEEFK